MSICEIAPQFIPPIPKILAIEDEVAILVLLQRAFQPWIVDLRGADSYAAVDAETDDPEGYDLVVLDLKIPGCNMSDLLRLVAKKTHCPVMVYSGNIDDHAVHAAIELLDRPVWFIQKPAQFTRERIQAMFRMVNLKVSERVHVSHSSHRVGSHASSSG